MSQVDSARFRRAPLAAAILATGVLGAAAWPAQAGVGDDSADDQGRTLQTVEVEAVKPVQPTSPKFTAPLLDTPQVIDVIPADVFNAQGAQNLTDVLRNTPGISFNAGENGFASDTNNFSLRGFDTSGSIFIDGVRDSGNYARDVFNLEQVEVAKGPSADNGRGGLGGYVNLVSKTPQLDDFTRGTASYGTDSYDSDDRLRGTLDVNRRLGAGAAIRLNVLAKDGGVAGRAHAESDAVGFAPSIAFGLDGDTRFTIAAQYLDQGGRPDWGVPGALVAGTIHHDPATSVVDRDTFFGLRGDFDDNESLSALARIEHDFGDGLTLVNQTRWSSTEREALYTLPFGYDAATQAVTGQVQAYQRENEALSNLTNVSAAFRTGGVDHLLSTGLELTRESSDALRFGSTSLDPVPVLHPDPRRVAFDMPAPTQSAGVDIDTLALYAYDTASFGERWQLTGGLRAERYEVEIGSRNLADGMPQGPDGYRHSDTTLNGKLGVVYKPVENGTLYASVAMAALPPGSWLSNPDISRTGDNAFPGLAGQNNDVAKTQRAINHELGVKWSFLGERLVTTAALFSTQRRSVAMTGKEPGHPESPTVLRGYGKQEVSGVELGINGRITDAWTIFAGAVFLDSERQHSAELDAARREANPGDYGDRLRTSGDELAFTPKRSASLWTTYAFDSGLMLGAGVQHVGESWVGRPDDADRIIANGRYGKLPGYTVANLVASYAFSPQVSVRLNIDNVADKVYATSGNWGMTRVFLGSPRAYLLSADFRF